jgi:hypothetical protein
MKPDLTNIIILALVTIVIVLPASLYAYNYLHESAPPSISDYCRANGYREVFPCADGSFKAIRDDYTEGFSQVMPDGRRVDYPFTLPQYQEGECRDFVVQGFCEDRDICLEDNSCVSDLDCTGECVNWTCG